MMLISIIDIIKTPNAVTHNFGIQVYDALLPHIKAKIPVTLSFRGLRNVTSGFANASVGKIYLDYPYAKDILTLEGVEENQIWKEKVSNAIYLATNEDKIRLQNEAISELLIS